MKLLSLVDHWVSCISDFIKITVIIMILFTKGGAIAIDLATKEENARRIWCLILENTFTSIPDMAAFVGSRFFQYLPLFIYKNKACVYMLIPKF